MVCESRGRLVGDAVEMKHGVQTCSMLLKELSNLIMSCSMNAYTHEKGAEHYSDSSLHAISFRGPKSSFEDVSDVARSDGRGSEN